MNILSLYVQTKTNQRPDAAQHTENIQFALLEYHLAIVLVVKEVPLEFSPRNDHVLALCSIEGKAISQ